MQHPPEIIDTPIASLNFSEEFTQMARINGFKIVADMLDLTIGELETKPGFDKRVLVEYLNFLINNNLDEDLD